MEQQGSLFLSTSLADNPPKTWRKGRYFDPSLTEAFELSRTKIELFMRCPRCFYLDRRLGVEIPRGPSFTLSSAVDVLLKKEFDIYRAKQQAHPLMKSHKISAVPFNHPSMNEWRHNFVGLRYLDKSTNLLVYGAVDDIWQADSGQLHVVDYKSTATEKELSLDDEWKDSYKRQMEIYQWLLEKNDFSVSDIGYFVYANGQTNRNVFDGKLEFKMSVLAYEGKRDWLPETLKKIKQCLMADSPPAAAPNCEYCQYQEKAKQIKA